jgi:uncharacterized protein
MTIVGAGPLIALLDRDDQDHAACVAAAPKLSGPLLTTWPAITEAMYLMGSRVGWTGQEHLWSLVLREDLRIATLDAAGLARARELMQKYRDLPMDLADATLVALAEKLNLTQIFTLDDDFRTYRLHGRKSFRIVP